MMKQRSARGRFRGRPAATMLLVFLLLLSYSLVCVTSASSSAADNNNNVAIAAAPNGSARLPPLYTPRLAETPLQLFLDVDNTLYREEQLLGKGINPQIINGIKAFCASPDKCHNLSGEQADGLYEMFGSTEEGLRRTIWKNATKEQLSHFLRDYYDSAYAQVDVSDLLVVISGGDGSPTGYSHAMVQQQETLRKLLRSGISSSNSPLLPSVTLSSNSPMFHVRKIVQALGLCQIFDSHDMIMTPDNCASSSSSSSLLYNSPTSSLRREAIFPTKASPLEYFGKLEFDKKRVALIDDSATNLKAVQRYMKGYLVSEKQSLVEALARAWGWLDEDYSFSTKEYLEAKNVVDEQSICRATWHALRENVLCKLAKRKEEKSAFTIIDVGAGLLSMHHLLLREGAGPAYDLPSLASALKSRQIDTKLTQINYVAYEPNKDLRGPCIEYLLRNGYAMSEEYMWDVNDSEKHVKEMTFVKDVAGEMKVQLSLRFWDFRRQLKSTKGAPPSPDLIVGCCFADLLAPDELTRALLKFFLNKPESFQSSALLYFPITFRGITQFIPASPAAAKGTKVTPSDTQAFAVYGQVLTESFNHYVVPEDKIESTRNYGGNLVASGSSDWKIDATENEYLWRTMLYFFATAAAPELHSRGFDATSWIQRAWTLRPSIRASNVDLLLRLPYIGRWESPTKHTDASKDIKKSTYHEIEFTGPNEVAFVPKQRKELKPDEVRIQSLASLISSGTELKVFSGSFDDADLDVNIKSMEGQRMGYPLAYGYSLVGRIVECGENVDGGQLNGRLVFAFSAHASEVVLQASAVHVIPEGIDPLDAIFMPSLETALSIVHDAHPRLGEKIVVYGQGLIGLLVTSLLSSLALDLQSPILTTVDTLPERLALSALLGSQQALLPNRVGACGEFDVSIEVSGNYRALQTAIDYTKNGGRVIVASWYGNENVSLKLGIDFHRSHKTIKTSQVSELPAELRASWTKQRRFDLVWDILKDIRPSRLLTRRAAPHEAKDAYEELSRGEQVSVAFVYS